jgi:hypothetical protein
MNQMRGFYEATIEDKKYGLKFNSNCFRLFSELRGIELHELGTVNDFEGIRDLIWCAGRAWAILKDADFPFLQLQIENWLDDLPDVEMAKIVEAIHHTRVFGVEIQAGVGDEEEKK